MVAWQENEQFRNLTEAVNWSVKQMETPRQNRLHAVRQYVGSHYADGDAERRVPTNLLEMAVVIYTRLLAVRSPRVMISTEVPELKRAAKEFELALNQVPREVGMDNLLRKAVVEAMFSMGVIKVGLVKTGEVLGHSYGEPFAELITIDDYFVDMSAKDYSRIQFEGNDYWVNYADVASSPDFPASALAELEPDDHTVVGPDGNERADSISADEGADTYKDRVLLRDVWLPQEQQIVTYAPNQNLLLRVSDWDGPDNGPYHRLGFTEVPGNLMPLPPVALWRDLHELANALFRKMGKQADSHKNVLAFSGNDEEAVRNFQNARDGEGIRWHGQKPENLEAGGIDQTTLAFYLQTRDLFSYFAGNLDMLGGLAPASDTVGQDQIMNQASSARMQDMKSSTISFVQGIYRAFAWYEWTDPVRTRTITKTVPNTDFQVQAQWSKATREGDFLDFNFDIDAYSMEDKSPNTQLQKLQMVTQQYIMPLLPLIQQQGGQMDFERFFELVAEYTNMPELTDFLRFTQGAAQPDPSEQMQGNPRPQSAGGGQQGAGQPAETKRTYERVNRPGATRSGKDQVMSQLLMGSKGQQSENASLFRSDS